MAALVIFDFDGTLVDSRVSIARCANAALEAIGRARVPDAAVHALIGLPLAAIFAQLVPAAKPDTVAAAVAAYRERFAAIDRSCTRPFSEILELLADLRRAGVRLAIATGKSTDGALASIARLGLDPSLFSAVLGGDAVDRPKPHPDMVLRILAQLDEPPTAAITVGDTTFDMEMSRRAEVPACGVTWGSHDAAALREAGASWIVDTRAELRRLLL